MVVPAFGFPIGDFIAIIQLTAKALRALREANGVSSHYQQTVKYLELLESLLQKVTTA